MKNNSVSRGYGSTNQRRPLLGVANTNTVCTCSWQVCDIDGSHDTVTQYFDIEVTTSALVTLAHFGGTEAWVMQRRYVTLSYIIEHIACLK